MNRNYELVVILEPEIKAEEQEKLLAKIKKFVTEAEGRLSLTKEWGKKELAYPIAKKGMAIFYVYDLSLPTDKAPLIKKKLELEEKILRFLLVNKERRSSKS